MVIEARRLRNEGLTLTDVCRRLTVTETSLRLWTRQYDERSSAKSETPLREVSVLGSVIGGSSGITMSTPDGFRFEGLDVDQAVLLFEVAR